MEELILEIKEKQKEIKDLQDQLRKRSNEVFKEAFDQIFNKYERLDNFSWTQYTPYFNDGDACRFSAHTDYIYVNGEHVDDCDWMNEKNVISWGTYNREKRVYEGRVEVDNPNYDPEMSAAVESVKNILNLFDNDFFEKQFGDHMRVTVSRNGVSTDYYEHD
jgi:hypothetical protein